MEKIDRVEEYIENYFKKYQNYKSYWNYEDGCVLIGAVQLYDITGDKKYIEYVVSYLEKVVPENGVITNYQIGKHNIDGFNCGKVLYRAYDYTNDKKFINAIEFLMEDLKKQPRTKNGNFWHKAIYPNQVWLDGLYMAQPFYTNYETRYNKSENYSDIVKQFQNIRKFMRDTKTGLYYHAYDESKTMFWADKKTGLSPNFWLRSIGWFIMALADSINAMSEQIYEHYRALVDIFRELADDVIKFQDAQTKLFYQVVDHPEAKDNYTETSGSLMIAYSLMKGVNLGVLSREKFLDKGIEIFDNVVSQKLKDGKLTDICAVAGLGPDDKPWRNGTVEYYISEAKTDDDAKGVGPLIMAYSQRLAL
ncbi:MAG: glycoside hydrolase family 88 protein [Eubacterium sp.]|jgi:unsaturated rhamnogalacturonyl hydrolase|nr:glycoside hydrolase family 88 protein [Eubacterium sp.]